MSSAEIIIVGSGAAGVAAAYQLRDRDVLVLDVGFRPEPDSLSGNLYDLRKTRRDLLADLLGSDFEGLHNVFNAYLSPKLKNPHMRFVTRDWQTLSPIVAENFDAVMSFAMGGLANAWGAGVYRYNDDDLRGFPIKAHDLDPYFDALTKKVGVSGRADALEPFFGSSQGLLPPLQLDRMGRAILGRYEKKTRELANRGLFIGRPRVAVLSQDHDGRSGYGYEALEFFKPHVPAIYTPAFTLTEMVCKREVRYAPGHLVTGFQETPSGVTAFATQLSTGNKVVFSCRKLILAAGALNSAKIVLGSEHDFERTLPLLDNAVSYIPLVDPSKIGASQESRFFSGVSLNAVYSGPLHQEPVQMSIYGMSGTLRSDFLFDFPLSVRANIAAAKFLTPAMVIVQLFYPDDPRPGNCMQLLPSGALKLKYEPRACVRIERHLVRAFRLLGLLGSHRLCRYLAPGNSFHYAGALPMRENPEGQYETDRYGRLNEKQHVYIADAASFPRLPSKNYTFAMMANAMRIADRVRGSLA